MTVSSLAQLTFFGLSILAGMAAGMLYNLLAAIRGEAVRGGLALLTDLIFWLAAGTAMVFISLRFNDGGIRAYQIVGASCGFFLHWLLLSRITMKISRFIIKIIKIILSPAAFIFRGIVLYIKNIFEKVQCARLRLSQRLRRTAAYGKTRKKIRKKYKKML